MKNVTEMTDTVKSPIKADILYVTQILRNSGTNGLIVRSIYPHFRFIAVKGNSPKIF